MRFPQFLLSLLLAGCASAPPAPGPSLSRGLPFIAERYVSAEFPGEELDSLAAWTTPQGDTWLIASGKNTHRLRVFDADSGAPLRMVGTKGQAPGQFGRPNGLAVVGNLLFVVERDNHRVQVLRLPTFAPLGTFGSDSLRSPYGIWVHEPAPGRIAVYVTDSFMEGQRHDVLPPLAQLNQRVRQFALTVEADGESIRSSDAGAFGDTSPAGALRMVESIAGDTVHDRLLIADEATSDERGPRDSTLREYTLAGRATGRATPPHSFAAEAEGIVLWRCGPHDGYWIAVDQLHPRTVFHVFDQRTLKLLGSFQGARTASTDGIALQPATRAFTHGALFAVHDDKAVSAFDLGEVAHHLHLSPGCTR